MTWTLHTADVVDWLREYDGPRFHAAFADGPYNLAFMGRAWDTFKDGRAYQDWVTEWGALLIERALYPGAVCAFFGGTRTWARLGVGLEDAGFEPFDTVAWIYAQGFPKNYNISKGIDKAAGQEREVLGRNGNGRPNRVGKRSVALAQPQTEGGFITAPATADATRWEGWGTALKPAFEPILLMRAPRNGATYVDLALEYGTGALNVEGCRVGIGDNDSQFREALSTNHIPLETAPGNYVPVKERKVVANPHPQSARHNAAGRYPPNLLLQHAPGCRRVGERRVRGTNSVGTGKNGSGRIFGKGESVAFDYTDPDGMETVAAWECQDGCVVKALGEQSGERRNGGQNYPGGNRNSMFGNKEVIEPTHFAGDTGTAARFFPQLEADMPEPFLYCAKASTSERSAGLEERCKHPTVKPLKVCEWVARLLLPPPLDEPRRILIPFAGVASEMIGACRAGFEEVIGVEMDAEYCAIGEQRLAHWLAEPIQESLL